MNNNQFKNIMLFCIGLFSSFFLRIIGAITIGEILVLFLFLFLMTKKGIYYYYNINKDLKIYTNLLLLAAFSCIISSLLTGSIENTLKGLFSILLLIPGLYVFFWLLYEEPKKIIYYLIGAVISGILVNNYFHGFSDLLVNQRSISFEEQQEVQFAALYIPYFVLFIALLYNRFPKLTAILMIFMGIFLLYGFSRSSFLIYIISSAILLFASSEDRIFKMKKHISTFLIVICITAWGAKQLYSYWASNGTLGKRAYDKYEMQSGNKGGILSSRNYFIRGLITLTYHPILGIGIYNKVDIDESIEIRKKFAKITGTPYRYWDDNVASHSAMLDWWIFFGILALPFWLYVIKQCYIFLTKYLFTYRPLTAYLLLTVVGLLWSIFFSPFGYRLSYAISLTLMAIIKSQDCNLNKDSNNNEI